MLCAGDVGAGWEEKKKDGKVVQELKIEAPAVTEEDQYGYVMPERYRCDACKVSMDASVARVALGCLSARS
eukprot:4639648-Amphidinium_carterae.1